MPEIVFENVEKKYGEVLAVLVGPSGCGKSTTLRLLAGLESLSGGEIYFDGRPVGALEPKARDIAMVFQDYALYPHMNIAKNMSFALRLERKPKAEIKSRVNQVAKMLNIDHLLERKPAELSGGQRQRVAMGRALVRDASTFLFDEPLSNLDAKLRAKLRTELAEMRDQIDKNMIYVTHDQVEAMTLGDRIVVMNAGVIQQQGTPEELFKTPVNLFVAGFIGSPTMNFLDAKLVETDGALHARGIDFNVVLTDEQTARLKAANTDRDIVLGIRPSSMRLNAEDMSNITLKVIVAEYLGSQSILVAKCAEQDFKVEVASLTRFKAGEFVEFGIDNQEVMIFDKATGLRI